MSEPGEHVLLRDDLDPAFDEAGALAAIKEMADKAGDWRGHVPYAAARSYLADPGISAQYESHVDGCTYCRRLIDALNPTEQLLDGLHELLLKVQRVYKFSPPESMTSWLVDYLSQKSPAGSVYSEFLADPGCLTTLESSEDVTAKFKAARIYLDAARQELAYRRIGEGCKLANVDRQVVACMTSAARSWRDPTGSPADSAHELRRLIAQPRLESERQQLQVIGVLARLGQHPMAMTSLHTLLIRRGDANEVVDALEEAELVSTRDGDERWRTWFAPGMRTRKKLAAMVWRNSPDQV